MPVIIYPIKEVQTPTAVARITATTRRNQSGTSRIASSSSTAPPLGGLLQMQQGFDPPNTYYLKPPAPILVPSIVIDDQSRSAISRIRVKRKRNQFCVSSILNIQNKTQTGTAHISLSKTSSVSCSITIVSRSSVANMGNVFS